MIVLSFKRSYEGVSIVSASEVNSILEISSLYNQQELKFLKRKEFLKTNISDVAPSCPIISFKKVQTMFVTSSGKRRDYLELTVLPTPLTALTDLALNLTFLYKV